jgi:putative endonuclease
MKRYWCYIMSNKSRRLYIGFTDDLTRRVFEHREKLFPESFTARYVFDMLVFYEEYSHVVSARMRERKSRDGDARRKLKLILAENPEWEDLSLAWEGDPGWILLPEARPRLKRKLP